LYKKKIVGAKIEDKKMIIDQKKNAYWTYTCSKWYNIISILLLVVLPSLFVISILVDNSFSKTKLNIAYHHDGYNIVCSSETKTSLWYEAPLIIYFLSCIYYELIKEMQRKYFNK